MTMFDQDAVKGTEIGDELDEETLEDTEDLDIAKVSETAEELQDVAAPLVD